MHRDEHIRNLTPITNVSEGASAPNEPEGTFLVGKLKPKNAGTTIIDDIINPVTCKELYPFYMDLPQEEFVIRLNKTFYDAEYHQVIWNADTHSSGVYFVKMVAGSYVNTQKLMLVK